MSYRQPFNSTKATVDKIAQTNTTETISLRLIIRYYIILLHYNEGDDVYITIIHRSGGG